MIHRGDLFRDPKFYVFLGLLLLLVIVNLRPRGSTYTTGSRGKAPGSTDQKTVPGDPVLMAEKLSDEKLEFEQEKRNIFAFFQEPSREASHAPLEQTQQPPPPDPVCGNGICESGEDLTICPDDCQPPPPPAPVISLRYIGYLQEGNGSVAFLTDGKEVFMGRVNDVIANQYRVLKITEDTVELGFLNNNQSSTIRFQGSQGG